MNISGLCGALILVMAVSCSQHGRELPDSNTHSTIHPVTHSGIDPAGMSINEALLLTRFTSLEALQQVVQIQYSGGHPADTMEHQKNRWVMLTHQSAGRQVISLLESGISQADFANAINGTVWDKVMLALDCPYAVWFRKDLWAIEHLGRRRPWVFGKGDVAFYDIAETMVQHIYAADRETMSEKDLDEKGYLNTFNHIAAQAFMTTIFSEKMADFVADVHERFNLPELITGHFTPEQLADLEKGPVDNYVDMINNEWGQELGKVLGSKYRITRKTVWTPELLTAYLNDIQSYHSWAFQIGFAPFRTSDEKVIQFANKINTVLDKP